MRKDFQDKIDDYLLNRMSDEKRTKFESEAAANKEFGEQLSFTETVLHATRSRNEKLAAMKEWKDDYVWKDESSVKKMLYWVSGIAAILVVGVFVYNHYIPSSSDIAMKNVIAMKTVSSHTDSLVKKGNVSFKGRIHGVDIERQLAMGDYSKALARIEMDEADVRIDLMLLERELHSRGKSHEDAMTDKEVLEMRLHKLLYLKAQALIGLERMDEALGILDEIRHSKGDYAIRADSLYHQLQ